MPNSHKPHLDATRFLRLQPYQSINQGGNGKAPFRRDDPSAHGQSLQRELQQLKNGIREEDTDCIRIELLCENEILDVLKSLDGNRGKFVLLNALKTANGIRLSIRLNRGGLKALETKIQEYLTKQTARNIPKHAPLLNAIRNIRKATVQTIWTENLPFPEIPEAIWWEGWLLCDENPRETDTILEKFRNICATNGFDYFSNPKLRFTERTLVYFRATPEQLSDTAGLLDDIAELRKPTVFATAFENMQPAEQREWTDDLLQRIIPPAPDAPVVGLLDTGVMHAHPLLKNFIFQQNCLDITNNPDDIRDHGTGMVSLIFFGEKLPEHFIETQRISIPTNVRSVKIIPDNFSAEASIEHTLATLRTAQGIAKLEENGDIPRNFCLATTCSTPNATPDAWSSLLDAQTYETNEFHRRLFFVSTGNIRDTELLRNYPNNRDEPAATIETPAQAWNAVTVGGFTNLATPALGTPPPLAQAGGLSPHATTSLAWQNDKSLVKPEIVFEAGNAASGGYSAPWSLLVASATPPNLYGSMAGTSPATALAARFHAELSAAYPHYSQELLRALLIHSAEWTPAMERTLPPHPSKEDYIKLARKVGYGVPDLRRAISCANNHVTLIAEGELQPFSEGTNKNPILKEMAFFDLSNWPITQTLQENIAADFIMRLTLSYFIEPNPGNRSYKNEFSYASHQLRFQVSRKNETRNVFLTRINKAAVLEENEDIPRAGTESEPDSSRWLFGAQSPIRTAGSIHTDTWKGNAAEMLQQRYIAIYPTKGWWKTRKRLNRFNSTAKFALVVSFEISADVDIYTPLQALINLPVEQPVPVEITH